jgi:hypothetical protein
VAKPIRPVFLHTPSSNLSPEQLRLADVPYRELHAQVLDALIRDPDPVYGTALRVVEHLQVFALRKTSEIHWAYLEVLQLEWAQTVDLPPLIREVHGLLKSAWWLSGSDRSVSWVP